MARRGTRSWQAIPEAPLAARSNGGRGPCEQNHLAAPSAYSVIWPLGAAGFLVFLGLSPAALIAIRWLAGANSLVRLARSAAKLLASRYHQASRRGGREWHPFAFE